MGGSRPLTNRNQTMPRKSSTNTRALSTQIRNIRKEISPIISFSRAASNPPAMQIAYQRWVPRRIRILKYTSATTSASSVTSGDVGTALGLGASETGSVRVLGFSAWNISNSSSSSCYISAGTDPVLTTNEQQQYGEDVGNGTSTPGVKCNIPDVLAKAVSVGNNGTQALFLLNPYAISFSGTKVVQTLCIDVTVLFNQI